MFLDQVSRKYVLLRFLRSDKFVRLCQQPAGDIGCTKLCRNNRLCGRRNKNVFWISEILGYYRYPLLTRKNNRTSKPASKFETAVLE